MASQRYISTSFWDDEWIQTLDPSEKLLYLYLMTNPLTNIAGVYKITDRRISFDTGFNLETIKAIFTKFEAKGKAYRFNEYVAIPSWPKHQEWERRQRIKEGIVAELQKLSYDVINFLDEIGYQFDLSLIKKIIIAKKQRKGVSGTTVKKLRAKYKNMCAKCGSSDDLHIHHIVPIKEGGDNSFNNLILLCSECHKKEHQSKIVHIPYVDNRGHETQSTIVPNYSDIDSDIDSNSDTNRIVCSELPPNGESLEADEPPESPESPVFCTIITNTGDEYSITEELVAFWEQTYPAVDVRQQLLAMKAWSIANPTKRKTRRGVLAFVNNWLSKEQNRSGSRNAPSSSRQPDKPPGKPSQYTLANEDRWNAYKEAQAAK